MPDLDLDLDQLERIADEASDGPWRLIPNGRTFAGVNGPATYVVTSGSRAADARHIATFDPPKIKELLALVRRQAAQLGALTGEGLADRIRQALTDHGIAGPAPDSLHSWRCEHPDRYGPCSCVADLIESITGAVYAEGDQTATAPGAPDDRD